MTNMNLIGLAFIVAALLTPLALSLYYDWKNSSEDED